MIVMILLEFLKLYLVALLTVPGNTLKIIGKKIFTILAENCCLSKPVQFYLLDSYNLEMNASSGYLIRQSLIQ